MLDTIIVKEIYEEDEHLLQAGNTSGKEIRTFLTSFGYNHYKRHGTKHRCSLYKRIDIDPDCSFHSTKLRCMKSDKSAMMS
jgi:hypothetical protein